MEPLAKKHFEKILKQKQLIGPKTKCSYFPCHNHIEDCTFCFCPFYPCNDPELGHYIKGKNNEKIWDCSNCEWIHKKEIAEKILKELKNLNITPNEIEEKHKELLKIKDKIKNLNNI